MVLPFPKVALQIWGKWNIRSVVLISLSLQIFLIVFAPFRKRTHVKWLRWFIWLAYLLADWAACFCIGLISNQEEEASASASKRNLMAFWAPFLLLHLGGPDTITAFALEDNELWLRHLLALLFQALTAAYAFVLTLPANNLSIPTLLMFLAGLIKYLERTRALFLASTTNFRRSMVPAPDAGPDYARLLEQQYSYVEAGIPAHIENVPNLKRHGKPKAENGSVGGQGRRREDGDDDDVSLVKYAYYFVDTYKGLIADKIFSFVERNECRRVFLGKTPEDALRVIEVELSYIYELFYTKVPVVRNTVGYLFRFVSFGSIVVALGLFIWQDKYGFDKFDVAVTYTLLYGAVALDTLSFLLLIFSDRTIVSLHSRYDPLNTFMIKYLRSFLGLSRPRWSKYPMNYGFYLVLSTPITFRRWCETISGHSLITYCLRQCYSSRNSRCQALKSAFDEVVDYFGAREQLEVGKYKQNYPFLKQLWEFIMEDLKIKSEYAQDVETTQRICCARGEWVLQASGLDEKSIDALMPFVDTNAVTFDESLIVWHVATHLCLASDRTANINRMEDIDKLVFSELLSDYMLYLLVMQPSMMSTVAGIGQIRFQDTCAEAKSFLRKRVIKIQEEQMIRVTMEAMEKKACEELLRVPTAVKPSEVKGDRSKSLLFDACRLAKVLKALQQKNKWEIISHVWVEMLSFAACSCRPIDYVKQFTEGGELISIVWLLMVNLGLGRQFQVIGHGDATLIVDE